MSHGAFYLTEEHLWPCIHFRIWLSSMYARINSSSLIFLRSLGPNAMHDINEDCHAILLRIAVTVMYWLLATAMTASMISVPVSIRGCIGPETNIRSTRSRVWTPMRRTLNGPVPHSLAQPLLSVGFHCVGRCFAVTVIAANYYSLDCAGIVSLVLMLYAGHIRGVVIRFLVLVLVRMDRHISLAFFLRIIEVEARVLIAP